MINKSRQAVAFDGISIKDLSKEYDGRPVLDRITLELAPAGVYALMGPSGCGKTTLLRIICGLETQSDGEIIGGGIGRCAFAFQEHRLFPSKSALDNVVCVMNGDRSEARVRATELLARLGLTGDALIKPASKLSGGMRQRVSLARAFAADMPIVLLDEPDKELDPSLRVSLADLIRHEGEVRCILAVTHSEDFAQAITDKIIKI